MKKNKTISILLVSSFFLTLRSSDFDDFGSSTDTFSTTASPAPEAGVVVKKGVDVPTQETSTTDTTSSGGSGEYDFFGDTFDYGTSETTTEEKTDEKTTEPEKPLAVSSGIGFKETEQKESSSEQDAVEDTTGLELPPSLQDDPLQDTSLSDTNTETEPSSDTAELPLDEGSPADLLDGLSTEIEGATEVEQVDDGTQVNEQDLLDTVHAQATGGNWVYKNYWWRKIEEVYSTVQEGMTAFEEIRRNYFEQFSQKEKESDRFYQHVGLEQGPLEDIVNIALEVIDKEKKEQGYLNKKERALLDRVKDKQRKLEQLKADVKAIEELDDKIDEALETVMQQIDKASGYQREIFTIFKDVAKELSDKQARNQFYKTEALSKDITNIQDYLNNAFLTYYQKMLSSLNEHTQSIISQLSSLEQDGIVLKNEVEAFEKEDEAEEANALERKRSMQEKKQEEKAPTILQRITSVFKNAFGYWMDLFKTTYQKLVSGKKTKKKSAQKMKQEGMSDEKTGSTNNMEPVAVSEKMNEATKEVDVATNTDTGDAASQETPAAQAPQESSSEQTADQATMNEDIFA